MVRYGTIWYMIYIYIYVYIYIYIWYIYIWYMLYIYIYMIWYDVRCPWWMCLKQVKLSELERKYDMQLARHEQLTREMSQLRQLAPVSSPLPSSSSSLPQQNSLLPGSTTSDHALSRASMARRAAAGGSGDGVHFEVYVAKYSYDPVQYSPNENPEAELKLNAGDYIFIYGSVDEVRIYIYIYIYIKRSSAYHITSHTLLTAYRIDVIDVCMPERCRSRPVLEFPVWWSCFLDGLRLSEGGPVDFGRGPLHNSTSSYEQPRCQMVENDWINLTRLNCVTSETHRRGYSTDSDCPRLTQSISIVFLRGGSRPEVVFQSESRCSKRVFLLVCDFLN